MSDGGVNYKVNCFNHFSVHLVNAGPFIEWKVDIDSPMDTHRHLSHLIGVSTLNSSCDSTQKNHSYTQVMLSHHMILLCKVV